MTSIAKLLEGEVASAVNGASVLIAGDVTGPERTGFEHLFARSTAGDNEVPSPHPERQFGLLADDPHPKDRFAWVN